jgi:hypothetical protein
VVRSTPGLQSRAGGIGGNELMVSCNQPGAVSAILPAIIIVFNLNAVASLEHTKYVRLR